MAPLSSLATHWAQDLADTARKGAVIVAGEVVRPRNTTAKNDGKTALDALREHPGSIELVHFPKVGVDARSSSSCGFRIAIRLRLRWAVLSIPVETRSLAKLAGVRSPEGSTPTLNDFMEGRANVPWRPPMTGGVGDLV
jgi:hypothetical protein